MRGFLTLTLAAAVVTGGPAAHAICPPLSPLTAWPPADVALPTNARILITAHFDEGRALLLDLLEGQLRLVATDGLGDVPLRVVERYQIGLSQAVLAPVRKLRASTEYTLSLPGVTASWLTAADPDDAPPEWTGAAVAAGEDGPRRYAESSSRAFVRVPVGDDGNALAVLVHLRRHGTREEATFLARVEDGRIAIGTNYCTGTGYKLVEGEWYQLSLTAVDLAGHTARAPGPVVVGIRTGTQLRPEPWVRELPPAAPQIHTVALIFGAGLVLLGAFLAARLVRRGRGAA